ncbi:uncharacterized protein LOC115959451 [Quercus lobata]|uniref:uncharacterized protein LOC115959451 n=1 Tax=Quercus lobata TaxID=97700 RepID=UPI00124577A8|nr:uncharacterized protein LOC115959451 [Quercus lobata]
MRDFRSDRYNNSRPRRDFAGQLRPTNTQAVNAVFREPVHQVLEKVKNEPFFKWSNKMVGKPLRRNQNLYCQYHQDQGHTTKDCRNLWDHLDQLVQEGKLKHLLHHTSSRVGQTNSEHRRDDSSRPPLGMINVIFTAPGRTSSCHSRDKIGTIQPHDDALVVTLRIEGYDVKRMLVDQGSIVEVMYPDLYKGLRLKLEDLTTYNSPLISFEGKTVIPKGQIRLPIQTSSKVVEVNFIVVDVYSPYTVIVARPWLHALEAVSSTLHWKVKYPSGGRVEEIVGN